MVPSQHRKLLSSHRWQQLRAAFRNANPLCVGCHAVGRIEAATVVDHIVPHRGDLDLFWDQDNLQACCKWHHDSIKQVLELRYERGTISAHDLKLNSSTAIALTHHLGITTGADGKPILAV